MITHIFNSSIVSGPEMLVLPALKKLDVPVSIIFLTELRLYEQSQRPIEYAKSLGHNVYSVPVRSRWDREAFLQLRRVLDTINPEIAHAHDVKASLYLYQAKKIRKGFHPKTVSTHHGAAYRKGIIRLYEEYYVRNVLPHFDFVLAVCSQDKQSMIRRGIAIEKVAVHLNGIDKEKIVVEGRSRISQSIRSSWKEKFTALPHANDAYFLGAVARLSPEKRHDKMIMLLRELNLPGRLDKQVVLLCFGTGKEEERLRKLAHDLDVEKFVFWMGYSNSISSEMAGFDLLLCLSDGEGIPINLLEAGWSGTPVLSTQVGGIPDLISTSRVGYLVDKSDSHGTIAKILINALKNPQDLERKGKAYQDLVCTRFSQKAWLHRLNEVYAAISSLSFSESLPSGANFKSACARRISASE